MAGELKLYNTINRSLEIFFPKNPPLVGMYVCGPTVYGYPHLGHCRGPVVFDVLHRYLKHCGYKVRYVKNVTDVGHLVNDADEGEDKIAKKARLDQLEPMEVAQFFTNEYRKELRKLNILDPSIEPVASGHIMEQIDMITSIMQNGYAYESNGSVYFDVLKYHQNTGHYGELSGRVLEDLVAGAGNEARELEGQEEKRNPNDFALWKKASPEHIMRWRSPWSDGFPGWHIECSAMSKKYLGEEFDIHGGGMDLLFPHHESEIAQCRASHGHQPARYWIHHNMVTINGQKMAKRLDNGVNLKDFFTGNHHLLERAYSGMTLRYFILQAHYRGTLDFSNEALVAAEKGMMRLLEAQKLIPSLKEGAENTSLELNQLEEACYNAINEDLNTPILIANLHEAARTTNTLYHEKTAVSAAQKKQIESLFSTFLTNILGIVEEKQSNDDKINAAMKVLIDLRNEARSKKDFATSDFIRNSLKENGIVLKDEKDGTTFSFE